MLKVIGHGTEAQLKMHPDNPKDKQQIGEIGEAGLWLVSDRTPLPEWESHPRHEPKRPRERLGPIRQETRGMKKRRS